MFKNPPETSSLPEIKTKTKSIEKQLSELDAAVEWFYGDDFSLDEALEKYQSAAKLAEKIESDLEHLKNEVKVIADFTKS